MAHVKDRWMKPGPTGRRVRSERWGKGKRWLAVWTDPDGRERSQAWESKDGAVAFLARINVDAANGAYVSPQASAETLRAYGERWRTQQLHHRESTADSAESRLRVMIYPALGDRALGSIRRSDVQALVTTLAAGYAPATVHVAYSYLSAILKAAVDDRAIASTPCVRIKLPTIERPPITPLPLEVVNAIAERVQPRWRGMVLLAAQTGMRSAELRGLTVDRITPPLHVGGDRVGTAVVFVDRQLTGRHPDGTPVLGPPKKPASVRRIHVGPSTAAMLVEHLTEHGVGPGGLVFHSRHAAPLSRSGAANVWNAATEGMGLRERSGWHDLRHFHASLLIASGMSVRAVADRLGHQDPTETLRTYAHMWPGDDERAVNAVEDVWGSARTSDGPDGQSRSSEG